MECKSCDGCKYIMFQDSGYSNYTVLNTDVHCLLDLNENLPSERPYDWNQSKNNWKSTNCSRCDRYCEGDQIHLDVEGEESPEDCTDDEETLSAFREYMK